MIEPTLCAVSSKAGFPDDIVGALQTAGYECQLQGFGVFCWRENNVWRHHQHGPVANGFLLRRFASKGPSSLLAVTPRAASCSETSKRLTEIESGEISRRASQRPDYSISRRINGCREIIEVLGNLGFGHSAPHDPVANISDQAWWILGSDQCDKPLQGSLWNHLKTLGTVTSRPHHTVRICSEIIPSPVLERLATSFARSLASIKCDLDLETIEFESAQDLLSNRPSGPESSDTLFLIGITGSKGMPVPTRTQSLLDRLDQSKIPYRVFSDATTPGSFALNDQIPHMCELTGASSYQVKLPEVFDGTLFLGFDLGHPKKQAHSVPVMTVVNQRGRLLGFWRGIQPRDETFRSESLSKANSWFLAFTRKNLPDIKHIVALRDGRRFENDGLEDFLDGLPWPCTLLEIVKNPVPLLVDGDRPAKPGTLYQLEENIDALLQTTAPLIRTDIGLPIRVRIVHNPSQLTIHQLGGAIYGLCHAPTLGLRSTRVPSPIYWSDGLAQESGRAIQFRGMNHIPHT